MARLGMVVDADGHYAEIPSEWAAHMPLRHRGAVPKLAIEKDGRERFTIGDLWVAPQRSSGDSGNLAGNQMGKMGFGDGLNPRIRGSRKPIVQGRRLAQAHPGASNPQARLKFMDDEGISVSVLYPTLGLASIPGIKDVKVGSFVASALNDWLVERFCSADPERLLPVATIPLHDPKYAVAELERCVKKLGMRAAWVAPSPTMGRTIDDPANDPVWKKASDLGIPMTTHHGSGGGGLKALGRDRNKTWLGAHAMGHSFEAMAAIVGLYTSGVFQRFPKLRWGFMEAGTGWLPFWLHQVHEHAERMEHLIPDVKLGKDINEHFHGRFIVTAEADDLFVNNAMDAAGDNAVVWASDFPHFDCSLPGLADELRDRTDLSAKRMKMLAVDNAVEFFDIKVPKIRRAKK